MGWRDLFVLLMLLAPLSSQAVRVRVRRSRANSSRSSNLWNTADCGSAPDASNGLQHICASYPSKNFNGDPFWMRGFAASPVKEFQGCYIFLYGSQNDFTPGKAHEPQLYAPFFTREMANEGYCAVQVDYHSPTVSQFTRLPGRVRRKAEDVFGSHSSSALSKLSAMHGCDCSKRTVVHGHSQGGMIVSLAGAISPWVEKILVLSGGCHAGLINVCTEVNRHQQLSLSTAQNVSSDMRPGILTIGTQSDGVLGCGVLDPASTSIHQLQAMSGEACGASTACKGEIAANCVSSKGTGYYVLTQEARPAQANSNHNWFLQMAPLSEENESLRTWSRTHDVERILHGSGSIFDSGYDHALAVNEAFKDSDEAFGWRACKKHLTS